MEGQINDGGMQRLEAGSISESLFVRLCALHHAVFHKPGRGLDGVMAKKRPIWMPGEDGAVVPGPLVSWRPPARYVVFDGDEPVANAAVIYRRVQTDAGPMDVLGLSDVATSPRHRGQGLGVRVVEAAFAEIGAGLGRFFLFQTGEARHFYEQLGCRVVDNRFFDSTAEDRTASPFTDACVMVYPGDGDWPVGPIDLQGPGF